jgi:hypothetical protein
LIDGVTTTISNDALLRGIEQDAKSKLQLILLSAANINYLAGYREVDRRSPHLAAPDQVNKPASTSRRSGASNTSTRTGLEAAPLNG